jgi:hypothetical protein
VVQIPAVTQLQALEHILVVEVEAQAKQVAIQVKLVQEIHQQIAQQDEKVATELLMQLPDTVNIMVVVVVAQVTILLVVMLVLWRWPWEVPAVVVAADHSTSITMPYSPEDFQEQVELLVVRDLMAQALPLYN